MTREFNILGMKDGPEMAYVVGIPENSTERYATTVLERFEEMFDEADITVAEGKVGAGDSLTVQQVTTEEFKEEYAGVEADD